MNLPSNREMRRRFWSFVRSGLSKYEAAEVAGVAYHSARRWFRQAGGVIPAYVRTQPRGRYLSIEEREEIFAGLEGGKTIRAIAFGLGRAPSTVMRELRRNMRQQYRTRSRLGNGGRTPRSQPWDYRPSLAQRRADHMASRPKPAKLTSDRLLREVVQAKLEDRLSPEQIAAQLRLEHPDRPEMWVSHETIYQSIYVQGRGALRRELVRCLRTGRALRKPRRKTDERRGRIANMINISERPPEAEDRAVPGHWEGDLLMGKNRESAIGTLVERKSRYVLLLHLPDGHRPEEVERAITDVTTKLPRTLWRSLTWDQGREMRHHERIRIATGLQIYFCDPAKPWQRGTNENTNGLLRQYFPKGTDLSAHAREHLEVVAAQMNRRPRKTLNWATPNQVLAEILTAPSPSPVVATTG